jgi:hypothetical protein
MSHSTTPPAFRSSSFSRVPPQPLFVRFPAGAVICHYAQVGQRHGVFTATGRFLAPSFFDLRHQFSFVCSVNGAGAWCILAPIPPASSQPALF